MIVKDGDITVEPADLELEAFLRGTMAKIEAILKEDDCAAFIIVAKPGGAHVRVSLDGTWSCARIEQDGAFSMTTAQLPAEDRQKIVAETGNVINMIADLATQGGVEMMVASEYVNDKYGLSHTCVGKPGPTVKH